MGKDKKREIKAKGGDNDPYNGCMVRGAVWIITSSISHFHFSFYKKKISSNLHHINYEENLFIFWAIQGMGRSQINQ